MTAGGVTITRTAGEFDPAELAGVADLVDRRPGVRWTKDYIKICSRSRDDLQEWASGTVGGEATLCSTCFG